MTTWTVGQVADLFGVTVRTLHHYDEIGLLTPSERSRAGYRLYTDADLCGCSRSSSIGASSAAGGDRVPARRRGRRGDAPAPPARSGPDPSRRAEGARRSHRSSTGER